MPLLCKVILSFAAGFFCGAVLIPGIHWLVYADTDPFPHGWPLLLEISAFVLATMVALRAHYPIVSALGLYAGLVALMLASGESEYPIASMIALAVHGLIPAALGVGLALWIRYLLGSRISQARATDKPTHERGEVGRL
jgi:hypothetical protein